MALLTREKVRELFFYEPSTGWLINRVNRNPRAMRGTVAGSLDGKGYLHIQIDKVIYRVHQLVWLYHFGFIPKMMDHKNRVRIDNRIENTRATTWAKNNANRSKNKNSVSRFKGVSVSSHGKWQAQTKVQGNPHHLGCYDTEEEAAAVYQKFMTEVHGDYFAP